MAESQSKIDIAAEKAFAEAAEKKASAESAAKQTAPVAAPVAKTEGEAAAKPAEASAPKVEAGKVEAPKPAARKPAAKKAAPRKAAAKKAAAPKKAAAVKTRAKTAAKPSARKPVAAAKTTKTTTITQLKDKIMATTKTTDFTAKAKEAAAEMQTRAKAAYDKGAELTSDVAAFHKGNFDAVVEAGKVLAAGMQDMGRTYVEDVKTAAETVTTDVKKMVAVKSPTELFQLQGEIARRNLDTLVSRTSKNAELMMKLANDVFAPISTRASVAMERFNKAA